MVYKHVPSFVDFEYFWSFEGGVIYFSFVDHSWQVYRIKSYSINKIIKYGILNFFYNLSIEKKIKYYKQSRALVSTYHSKIKLKRPSFPLFNPKWFHPSWWIALHAFYLKIIFQIILCRLMILRLPPYAWLWKTTQLWSHLI